MNIRRQYKNPPIVEAICEIRFAPNSEWDVTLPGVLLGLVKREYPEKPRHQFEQLAMTMEPGTFALAPGIAKVQFRSGDSQRLFAVGPQSISVHDLKPYASWENFKPRIVRALEAYLETGQKISAQRIGVRYVNKIEVKGDGIDFNEYVNGLPEKVEGLPDTLTSVFARFQFEYPGESIRLVVTCANGEALPDHLAMILDIDTIKDFKEAPLEISSKGELDVLLEWITRLRDKERDVFEALITDKSRELFDA